MVRLYRTFSNLIFTLGNWHLSTKETHILTSITLVGVYIQVIATGMTHSCLSSAGKQSTSLRRPNKGVEKACAYARLQRGAKLTNTARHTRFVCEINPRIMAQSKDLRLMQEQLTSPPPLKFWSLLSNMMRARANRNMIVP